MCILVVTCACLPSCPLHLSTASKSKQPPTATGSEATDQDKDKEAAPSPAKGHEDTPTTPTKPEKEKKEKPKKKEGKSKGAAMLPPVEAKPPPGPLVALGRREKPVKRPRSVERGCVSSLSSPFTNRVCMHCDAVSVLSHNIVYPVSVRVCTYEGRIMAG